MAYYVYLGVSGTELDAQELEDFEFEELEVPEMLEELEE